MDVYTTEEQQVEAFKNWWKKNGTSTVASVLIGLSVAIGGRMWLDQKHVASEVASSKFEAMMDAQRQGLGDIAVEQGAGIIGQHPDTPYAVLASMLSAKIKLEKGDAQGARNHYNWVITQSDSQELKQLARLRLARVMLDAGENDQALALLGSADAGLYSSSFEETKGDIYLAMNQVAKAKAAYSTALESSDLDSGNQQVLRMKLADLGTDDVVDNNVDNNVDSNIKLVK